MVRIGPPVESRDDSEERGASEGGELERVARNHPKMHGLSLVFLLLFFYHFSLFFPLISCLFVCLPLLPFLFFSFSFSLSHFSILRFWDTGLRVSGSPTRAGRTGRGQEMGT